MEALEISDAGIRNSIKRQVAAKQILPLMKKYYLIIPPEYKKLQSVPPELFIDDLMKSLELPYYVGLLSAASFYGATHQATQVFQIVVQARLKPIILGRTRVQFYFNKRLSHVPIQPLKTDRGPLDVSTPEATAFDLVRYMHQSGHLNHVATVLNELAENLTPSLLKKTAKQFPLVYAQRLGYLLEYLGHQNLAETLASYIKENKPSLFSFLRTDRMGENSKKDYKWYLIINESIEPDL